MKLAFLSFPFILLVSEVPSGFQQFLQVVDMRGLRQHLCRSHSTGLLQVKSIQYFLCPHGSASVPGLWLLFASGYDSLSPTGTAGWGQNLQLSCLSIRDQSRSP